ncbi:hypothetical protein TNCV_657311 [Trichonephila clavipes]|nr:hypothetical protein TNCV_657311 [Trichonephila clavipes]
MGQAYHDKAGWTGIEHKVPHPGIFYTLTHRPLKWPTSDAQFDIYTKSTPLLSIASDTATLRNVCLGQTTCPRCGESGHVSADCPVLSDAPVRLGLQKRDHSC